MLGCIIRDRCSQLYIADTLNPNVHLTYDGLEIRTGSNGNYRVAGVAKPLNPDVQKLWYERI